FRVVKGSSVSLWMFSMKDKKAFTFGNVESSGPTNAIFSPDGHWVAYTVLGAQSAIFLQPFPTTSAKYQISEGVQPLSSPNGSELISSQPTGQSARSVTSVPTFTLGNPVPLPRVGFSTIGPLSPRRFDMMPDGRILGVIQPSQTASGGGPPPEIQVV